MDAKSIWPSFGLRKALLLWLAAGAILGHWANERAAYCNAIRTLWDKQAYISFQSDDCLIVPSDEHRLNSPGGLRLWLLGEVRAIYFLSGTTELRWSKSVRVPNPSLPAPSPEEVVRLTDADMTAIKRLTTVRVLDLSHTDVTDEALPDLSSLRHLAVLRLGQNVTPEGVERLQKELPRCTIDY